MKTLRIDTGHRGRDTRAVMRITLCRPDVRNAFNDEVGEELVAAFAQVDAATRVVVVTGEGAAFCAGADVAWMKRVAQTSAAENVRGAERMASLFATIDECKAVVIGRVNGPAMGGGVGVVACCDIVVSVDAARFSFSEARLGLVPAVISPFVLRKTGVAPLRRYFLTGETFDAHAAARIGLVHEVVAPDALDATVDALVDEVLRCGPEAVAEAKRLLREVHARGARNSVDFTAPIIAKLRASPEGQEGLAAFLEKRKPSWL